MQPIKHPLLLIMACLLIIFLSVLGMWQWMRAQHKKVLLQTFAARNIAMPLTETAFMTHPTLEQVRFFKAKLTGSFDNKHTFVLDNKTYHGQVGYEIYTPFITHQAQAFLVDRGFIAIQTRMPLPPIKLITNPLTIIGLIDAPPHYVTLGAMQDPTIPPWPMRIESIDLVAMRIYLPYPLEPYVIKLAPNNPLAYPIDWQWTTLSYERHLGYAVQWFALAITLLILCVKYRIW